MALLADRAGALYGKCRGAGRRIEMPRQKLIYGRPELRPPAALVEAVRQADAEAVAGHLAQDAKWAWADGLLLACRVPGPRRECLPVRLVDDQ